MMSKLIFAWLALQVPLGALIGTFFEMAQASVQVRER
jgi:hypothetical protein